jgi:hypothetical protein
MHWGNAAAKFTRPSWLIAVPETTWPYSRLILARAAQAGKGILFDIVHPYYPPSVCASERQKPSGTYNSSEVIVM